MNGSSDDGSRSPRRGKSGDPRNDPDSSTSSQFAKGDSNNSYGILRKIEDRDGQTIPTVESLCQPDFNGLRERYKGLIKQLPAKDYVDRLVVTFFREVNWHYTPLDEDIFMDQLQEWNNLTFSTLNQGPHALPADMRFFPAMLFQVVALALQFQPPAYDPLLDNLKYRTDMSLDDLSIDYSDSGLNILSLLGKKDITLVTIQAGFLRTYFLKNAGLVTESWHALGQTIRDAQEIGYHKEPADRSLSSPGKSLEAQWNTEFRRRMWSLLVIWDAHFAIMLGRPTNLDHSTMYNIPIPIDTPPCKNRKTSPPQPRSETDPPTSLTMLIANMKLLQSLWDILALEKDGTNPKDFTKVEEAHQRIFKSIENLPAVFRVDNPDMTWDDSPNCHWFIKARQILKSTGGFCLMALHKPYAFTNARHRSESIKAALMILEAQRDLFARVEAAHFKLYNLVISTFDAIVLAAAMYILHPNENRQYLDGALQHFGWAIERFDKMSSRNALAKSALGVCQAIHVRLLKVLNRKKSPKSAPASQTAVKPPPAPPQQVARCDSAEGQPGTRFAARAMSDSLSTTSLPTSNASNLGSSDYSAVTDPSSVGSNSVPTLIAAQEPEWNAYQQQLPRGFDPNFDFSAIQPLQPMHDLLFNDLSGMQEDVAPLMPANSQAYYGNVENIPSFQFEGDFRDDSFWYIMNQYSV
jgi:hypothetical protein